MLAIASKQYRSVSPSRLAFGSSPIFARDSNGSSTPMRIKAPLVPHICRNIGDCHGGHALAPNIIRTQEWNKLFNGTSLQDFGCIVCICREISEAPPGFTPNEHAWIVEGTYEKLRPTISHDGALIFHHLCQIREGAACPAETSLD